MYHHPSGDEYKREVPDRFSSESDDRLMNSAISKYAIEMKDPVTKKPNGQFFLDRSGAEAIAREVIHTHLGFSGQKLEDYFEEHVPDAWQRFDVNKDKLIEVTRVP